MPLLTDRLELARATAATIDGWLTDREGELLFRLADGCPPGAAIVEIGSWKGKSTVWLASGVRDPGPTMVFAIDPHEQSLEDPGARTLEDLKANLARADVGGRVVPIVATSHAAAAVFEPKPGLVFVDGSHLEEAVRTDLADWLPKLLDGGIVALHDVVNHRWAGPRRALRRELWRSTELTGVKFVDSIAWMTKVGRNTARDRWRNRLTALLLIAYDITAFDVPAPILALLRSIYRFTPLKRA
jgi:predicted O-methyltransferase YrrM